MTETAPPTAAPNSVAAIILAAGMGTRMRSDLPKVMHRIANRPMINHVIAAVEELGGSRGDQARIVVVVGPDMPDLIAAVAPHPTAEQTERLGTGHAARQAASALRGFAGDILILNGDGPFITAGTLTALMAARRDSGAAVGVLGFRAADPSGYGRLKTDASGDLVAIVEHKDATAEERTIDLCNSGIYCVDGTILFDLLGSIGNDNAQKEYYLTDIVSLARRRGLGVRHAEAPETEVMGINSRAELAVAERIFQDRARSAAMAAGVTLIAPETVWFSADTVLGRDVIVHPNVVFGPGVRVEDDVEIKAFSHLEGAVVRRGADIGPYARLRPGSDIGPGARIGNFVEVKNVVLEAGAKANHLSYLGDGHVGAGANIGAGTIFCNYDGVNKARTEIGAGAFIGSNSALVAPASIGAGAIVGAGSVITRPVEPDALALARGRQTDYPGRASSMREIARERKASKVTKP